MDKEFVSCEVALQLKKLGFSDSNTFGIYKESTFYRDYITFHWNEYDFIDCIKAPLYQQVFRWFRDEHSLNVSIIPEYYQSGVNFNYQITWYIDKKNWTKYKVSDGTMWFGDNGEFKTIEEAEESAIQMLIKLIKDK